MGQVWEVVCDGPDDDLRLRQPFVQPCRVERVDATGMDREVGRARRSEPFQPGVALAERLVEGPLEQVGV
jgi:hypothetical protein